MNNEEISSFLHSVFLLPPSAFRLLPSAFCLPPSAFCLLPSAFKRNGVPGGTPFMSIQLKGTLHSGVRGFPRSDLCSHLVFQMEFSLLQRFLFDFLFGGHLVLGGELT